MSKAKKYSKCDYSVSELTKLSDSNSDNSFKNRLSKLRERYGLDSDFEYPEQGADSTRFFPAEVGGYLAFCSKYVSEIRCSGKTTLSNIYNYYESFFQSMEELDPPILKDLIIQDPSYVDIHCILNWLPSLLEEFFFFIDAVSKKQDPALTKSWVKSLTCVLAFHNWTCYVDRRLYEDKAEDKNDTNKTPSCTLEEVIINYVKLLLKARGKKSFQQEQMMTKIKNEYNVKENDSKLLDLLIEHNKTITTLDDEKNISYFRFFELLPLLDEDLLHKQLQVLQEDDNEYYRWYNTMYSIPKASKNNSKNNDDSSLISELEQQIDDVENQLFELYLKLDGMKSGNPFYRDLKNQHVLWEKKNDTVRKLHQRAQNIKLRTIKEQTLKEDYIKERTKSKKTTDFTKNEEDIDKLLGQLLLNIIPGKDE